MLVDLNGQVNQVSDFSLYMKQPGRFMPWGNMHRKTAIEDSLVRFQCPNGAVILLG